MGKRSNFRRLERDAYNTPAEAVMPLLDHLKPRTKFIEPCAGAGCLVERLELSGHICIARYDLPDDACTKRYEIVGADRFITNPAWRRDILHPLIVNLSDQLPTWLLVDADWFFTQQAKPFLPRLRDIAVIGRCRWIPGSKYTSKDSCAWALFDRPRAEAHATVRLFGRSDSTDVKPARRAA
jgi:hypothetical protein